MLSRRELKQNVMHQRCVDSAGCVGSPDPHSQNFALRAAPVPSVALRDVKDALFDRCPDSAAAIAECRIAMEERDRCGDDPTRDKAIDLAVRGFCVVCAEVDHLSGD